MSAITGTSAIPTAVVHLNAEPPAIPSHWTLADLRKHLGGIPLERICLFRPLGMATEDDALWLDEHEDRLCELVDGVLVEKPMSSFESILAVTLIRLLGNFLDTNDFGFLLGEAGQLRILPSRMRIPDVSFIRWDRFPEGKLPKDRVYRIAPDLVVEILYKDNTHREMEMKLDEYFQAGVRLVWYIDPQKRTAQIYTARDQMTEIDEQGHLDGRDVLPGFTLRLGELFERAERKRQPTA